uniref:Uncharacterized protein n=1 Tax=Melopsittacus undulatus TaxID=13146 RepID=A0A8C6NCD7_MELUD
QTLGSLHPWVFQTSHCESWCDHGERVWPQPQAAGLEKHRQIWGQIHVHPLNLTSIAVAVDCIPICLAPSSPAFIALPITDTFCCGSWWQGGSSHVWLADLSFFFQFLCCGKHSPFGETTNVESKTCPPGQPNNAGQDCLLEIQFFLKKHMDFVTTLLGITIGFTVYGMILTSFLWFSIHFSSNLDRKGKYILRER